MAAGCQIQACEGFWASWFMDMLCYISEKERAKRERRERGVVVMMLLVLRGM